MPNLFDGLPADLLTRLLCDEIGIPELIIEVDGQRYLQLALVCHRFKNTLYRKTFRARILQTAASSIYTKISSASQVSSLVQWHVDEVIGHGNPFNNPYIDKERVIGQLCNFVLDPYVIIKKALPYLNFYQHSRPRVVYKGKGYAISAKERCTIVPSRGGTGMIIYRQVRELDRHVVDIKKWDVAWRRIDDLSALDGRNLDPNDARRLACTTSRDYFRREVRGPGAVDEKIGLESGITPGETDLESEPGEFTDSESSSDGEMESECDCGCAWESDMMYSDSDDGYDPLDDFLMGQFHFG